MSWYDPSSWGDDAKKLAGYGVEAGTLGAYNPNTGGGWGRNATNWLGITSAPPPNLATPGNPAYDNLMTAAQQMNQNYGQATAGRQLGQGYAEHGMDQQQQTIDQLRQAASGAAPSAAESMMRTATDANARRQMAAAAAMQGSDPGMALRTGLAGAQQTDLNATSTIGAERANEMATASQTLAGATAQEQNAGNQIYSTGGNIESNAANAFNSANQAPFNAQMGQQQVQVQANAANQAAMGQLYGAVGKGIAASASDPQLKKDVEDGSDMSDEFLESISHPKEWRYKDPGAPGQMPGKRFGPMATDLPTHDVTTGPDGKKWISASAISDILGGLGRLHQRVSSVEAARAYA